MAGPAHIATRPPVIRGATSLRRRFLLLMGLAVIALLTAARAVGQLYGERSTVREAAAAANADALLDDLLARLPPQPQGRTPADAFASLRAPLRAGLAAVRDGGVGLCAPDGSLTLAEALLPAQLAHGPPPGLDGPDGPRGPHGAPGRLRVGLLPLDEDVVREACARVTAGATLRVRFAAPNDVLFVSVRVRSADERAWALVRVARRDNVRGLLRWQVALGLLAALAFALALTGHTLWLMRRGVGELRQALRALPADLAAPVPRPQAEELAEVADGLALMARDLAHAQAHSHTLERSLAHQERLAGLGRVVAGVAHEVRNPLAAMKLRLEAMARRPLDERSSRDVGVCLGELARLDEVVGALLLVSRKGPPVCEGISLGALARARAAALAPVAAARGVTVRVEGDADVRANASQLARVVDNLLRNAVEASPDGGVVRVSIEACDGACELRVCDGGDGVPAEHEGALFEPFFSLRAEGLGLGLFLSRSLLEAHGGTLRYARLDGLTVFTARLPSPEGSP